MEDTDIEIEIGSMWVRDGIKYEVAYLGSFDMPDFGYVQDGIYAKLYGCHGKGYIGFQYDFLKHFTPYKPIYKYQYVWRRTSNLFNAITYHLTDEEAADLISKYPKDCYVKIEQSKIEV